MNLTLNLAYLNEISDGDNAFIQSILQTFLEEAPKDIAKLKEAIDTKDGKTVGALAHKNKATLQLLGLVELKEMAFQIEQNAKEQSVNTTELIANAKLFAQHLNTTLPVIEQAMIQL